MTDDNDDKIANAIARISAGDLMIDSAGRVIIDNPALLEALRPGGSIDKLRRRDTNIICCGNGSCAQDEGSLIERMISSRL